MSKQRKIFGLGLLAGAAVGYWLNTDQGKAFRIDLSKKAAEYSDEVSALAKDNALKLSSNLTSAAEEGQNWVSGTKDKLKSAIHELADTADHAIDDVADKLETGLEKASRKVKENKTRLENGTSKKG